MTRIGQRAEAGGRRILAHRRSVGDQFGSPRRDDRAQQDAQLPRGESSARADVWPDAVDDIGSAVTVGVERFGIAEHLAVAIGCSPVENDLLSDAHWAAGNDRVAHRETTVRHEGVVEPRASHRSPVQRDVVGL